jgi:hypothetical protein
MATVTTVTRAGTRARPTPWVRLLTFILTFACAARASAQDPATPLPTPPAPTAPTDEPRTLRDRLKEPDQAGGIHFTKHFAVVFGGIKQGSGIALGPAYSTKFADGGFLQIKGVYSIKNFKLAQVRYDSRRFWSDRGIVISRLRAQDAPELSVYQLGPLSPDLRVDFGERKTEGSTQLIVKTSPAVRVAAGFGIERYATTGGELQPEEGSEGLPDIPPLPGLGTHPWFAHTFGSIGYDTRLSPDYSRDGRFVEAVLHDYDDWHDGQASFVRFEGTAQQLVPTFARRGVIDVSMRTWLSFAEGEQSVPFFLMPTLGGGELLRAFPSYRFRDRDAMLFKGEYRWAVHDMVDVAGVYEVGKVGPAIKHLSFRDMAHSIAVGLRVHSKTSALVRADVAHGREGFGFRIGFSAGG